MNKFLLFLLLLTACDTPQRSIRSDTKEEKINGRDGIATYQVEVPSSWHRMESTPLSALNDTTKAISEYQIEVKGEIIRITLHNFPDQRIPPEAQVARWKSQIEGTFSESAVSHDGFIGICLVTTGPSVKMLAWAMQMAPEHYQSISSPTFKQMRADYTIKAVGPVGLINRHQEEIRSFANSFRLIREIPTPS